MKILLLGATGQVGSELERSLHSLGELILYSRNEADLNNLSQLQTAIQQLQPNVIVNAAAYTYVDQAEFSPETAMRINAESVALLAEEAKLLNALLIHYSTDYVFDGTKTSPYLETDQPNPINVYGKSKFLGEQMLQATSCRHLIFRVSWIYSTRRKNFAKAIISNAHKNNKLQVVADQVGTPTSARLVANTTALCLRQLMHTPPPFFEEDSNIFHLAPSGETSWYGFSQLLISEVLKNGGQLKTTLHDIIPILTSEYPNAAAQRPLNSRLNNCKIEKFFNIKMPDWQICAKKLAMDIYSEVISES